MRDFTIGFVAALVIAAVIWWATPSPPRRTPVAACTIGQTPEDMR